jgi:hypothetical protein
MLAIYERIVGLTDELSKNADTERQETREAKAFLATR